MCGWYQAGILQVLLFSTMTRALDVMEDYLDWRGFEHLRLDGAVSTAERGDLVKKFNAPGDSTPRGQSFVISSTVPGLDCCGFNGVVPRHYILACLHGLCQHSKVQCFVHIAAWFSVAALA